METENWLRVIEIVNFCVLHTPIPIDSWLGLTGNI